MPGYHTIRNVCYELNPAGLLKYVRTFTFVITAYHSMSQAYTHVAGIFRSL